MAETKLQMADRHVRTGEILCARQEDLIGHLAERGLDTGEAERLLGNLRQTLFLMRAHRDEIRREIGL